MTISKRQAALSSTMTPSINIAVSPLPKVTIMIPTYNQARVLPRAIESALAQSHPNLEVVVADDASTDDTATVISRYCHDARLKYVCNEHNLGRVANYRRSLYEHATGAWTLNLDGDDYLTDTAFISQSLIQLAKNKDVVLVVGGQRFLEPNGRYRDLTPTSKAYEVVCGEAFFLSWNRSTFTVPHLGSLYKREVALELGFYQQDILSSDWESLRRLILQGEVLLVGRVVGVWVGHEENTSKSLNLQAHIDNLRSITEPYRYALKRGVGKPRLQKWRLHALAEYAETYVSLSIGTRNIGNARRFLAYLRQVYPDAYPTAVRRIAFNPKIVGKLVLLLGNQSLTDRVETAWRSLTRKGG